MAKAERILLTEPGVRLDMTREEAENLQSILHHYRNNKKISNSYYALRGALEE